MIGGSSRPWQGTALGIVDIIECVFAFLAGFAFLFLQGMVTGMLNGLVTSGVEVSGVSGVEVSEVAVSGVMGMLNGLGMAAGLMLVGVGVLSIFMARGAFKGQKWSPIVSIVFSILGIISCLSAYSSDQILSLAISVFVLYLSIFCVRNPYYASK